MWCRHCQQETPAIGLPGASGPRCSRCQRTSPPASESQPVANTTSLDDGDETRRSIYRTLRSAHATISAGEASRTFRVDVAQTPLGEALAAPHHPVMRSIERRAAQPSTSIPASAAFSTRGQVLAWLLASAGAGCIGLGIGLGAWSLLGGQEDLWNPAVAAAIGGQGLLIIGLLQLLSSIWNAARHAAGKLSLMHEELRRLRRTTEETAARNNPSAASFFADLAREAPAEMLLGNLRGQLDHLASRLR
jgi:hypothetical protein